MGQHTTRMIMPQCPVCGEVAVLDKGGMTTLMCSIPFVGEDGKAHDHDGNTHTGHWVCPKKHEWKEEVGFECSCGWKGKPWTHNVKILRGDSVSMLNLAMEYADLCKECAEALYQSAKAFSEGRTDDVHRSEVRYNVAHEKLRELREDLSRIPVPDEIAQKRPIARMGHDEIAKSMGGRIPGCGCEQCKG